MSEEYVLQLQHIRKEYPGVVALKDVTLELKPDSGSDWRKWSWKIYID